MIIEGRSWYMRKISMGDLEGFFDLDTDPEVHRFLGNKPLKSRDEVRTMIKYILQQYEDNDIGRLAVISKSTKEFMGWSGLKYETSLRKDFSYYDLGYRLRKKFWGRGIATETAKASLRYGFEELELSEINAAADIKHNVSNKILSNLGLSRKEIFKYENVDHNWYSITRKEWFTIYDQRKV